MKYALLGHSPEDEVETKAAIQELDKAIADFAAAYRDTTERHPSVGIGDTATDEDITKEIYKAIH